MSEAVSAPTSTATPGTAGGTAAAAQAAAARVGRRGSLVQWLPLARAHAQPCQQSLTLTAQD